MVIWEHTYPSGETLYAGEVKGSFDDEETEEYVVSLAFCRAEQEMLYASR